MRSRSKETKRQRSQRWGIIAEYCCAVLLLFKGYRIVSLRHRNRYGEIDIVASRGKDLVFIEVKARATRDDGLFSITADKQQRLLRAANGFVAHRPHYAQHRLRFDVMVITSWRRIHHLSNAWGA